MSQPKGEESTLAGSDRLPLPSQPEIFLREFKAIEAVTERLKTIFGQFGITGAGVEAPSVLSSSAETPSKLMELSEPKTFCPLDPKHGQASHV